MISMARRKKRKKQHYEADLARIELRMTRQALANAKKRDVSYVV